MRDLTKTITSLAAAALAAGLFAGAASADPAADRCGASKTKAAGRLGQGLLSCHATAMRAGVAIDPGCTAKVGTKLDATFTKAESAGGCETAGDAGAVTTSVGADADAIAAALAPDPDDAARACAATKAKASGKHYRAVLGCYAKGGARSEGPDPGCVPRAQEKLAGVFAKAESRGGCTTSGDLAAIDAMVVAAAEARVADLSPVCGDAIAGPGQPCEIGDDAACPGFCTAACVCNVPPDCGDGVAELPEECDDGANLDGDGCSATCLLEDTSALCDGVASAAGTAIDAVLVSDAFSAPIHVAAPPLDPSRLFVVERDGRIRIVDLATNAVLPTPFLDIADQVGTGGEGGLLSVAFHPDYETNRRFFVNYTNNDGDTTIARYEASAGNPNVADESTARTLIVIAQPYSNHNGGQVAFGPDGYLYVGMGDGGGGGDPDETAQDDGSLLGKMLRLDVDVEASPYRAAPATNPGYVDGTSDLELIWAKGLRNPWRFSFDRATGDLLIADVGQGDFEEIDRQAASSTGGENYGWDIFEGSMCYEPDPAPVCPAPPTGFTMPVFEYAHYGACTSLTGGFVYRGCALPDLAGTYFYSDACHNFLRTFALSGGVAVDPQDRTSDAGVGLVTVVSFGEDARGELYVVDMGAGSVYRLEGE